MLLTRQSASAELSSARQAALIANKQFGNRAVKSVVVVGQAIFVLDLLGRIYVWNVLDANPTLTPVGTHTWHYASKLFKEKDSAKTSRNNVSNFQYEGNSSPKSADSNSAM